MRWIAWGKKDSKSSERDCAGCEGSRVISPALLLTLDECSWRVWIVLVHSLLRSDLVAELNQTVIDVQRTDSMMAE